MSIYIYILIDRWLLEGMLTLRKKKIEKRDIHVKLFDTGATAFVLKKSHLPRENLRKLSYNVVYVSVLIRYKIVHKKRGVKANVK